MEFEGAEVGRGLKPDLPGPFLFPFRRGALLASDFHFGGLLPLLPLLPFFRPFPDPMPFAARSDPLGTKATVG